LREKVKGKTLASTGGHIFSLIDSDRYIRDQIISHILLLF